MPWGPPQLAKRLLTLLLLAAFVCDPASALRTRSSLAMAAPRGDAMAELVADGVASPHGTARGIAEALAPGDGDAGELLDAQGDFDQAAQVRERRPIFDTCLARRLTRPPPSLFSPNENGQAVLRMPGNAGLEVEKKCCEHGCLATVLRGYPQLGELFLCGKDLRDAAYTTGALAAACPALIVRTLAPALRLVLTRPAHPSDAQATPPRSRSAT